MLHWSRLKAYYTSHGVQTLCVLIPAILYIETIGGLDYMWDVLIEAFIPAESGTPLPNNTTFGERQKVLVQVLTQTNSMAIGFLSGAGAAVAAMCYKGIESEIIHWKTTAGWLAYFAFGAVSQIFGIFVVQIEIIEMLSGSEYRIAVTQQIKDGFALMAAGGAILIIAACGLAGVLLRETKTDKV